jgi:hypothetical protein
MESDTGSQVLKRDVILKFFSNQKPDYILVWAYSKVGKIDKLAFM